MRLIILLLILASVAIFAACGGGDPEPSPLDEAPIGDAAAGEELFSQRLITDQNLPGCVTCHSQQPQIALVGPPAPGTAARAEAVLDSGAYQGEATTPAGYIREGIVAPNAHIAEGFVGGIMSEQYGDALSEQELSDLVAYMLEAE